MLMEPNRLPDVLAVMQPDDFYREGHRHVFEAITQISSKDCVDLLTLRDVMRKEGTLDHIGGPTYLAALVDAATTSANVLFHAKLIRAKSLMRKLLTSSVELACKAYDDATPVEELITDARANIETLWRLSSDPETSFWRADNFGKAKHIDTGQFLDFVQGLGYYMLELNGVVLFVQNIVNILNETVWVKSINKSIKDAMKAWSKSASRRDVWDLLVNNGKLFSTQVLTGIDTLCGKFYRDAQDSVTLFFQNGALNIRATQVRWMSYQEIDGYLWHDQISPHEYHGRFHCQLAARIRQAMYAAMISRNRQRVAVLRRVLDRIHYAKIASGAVADEDITRILTNMLEESAELQSFAIKAGRMDIIRAEDAEMRILSEYIQDRETCEYRRFLELVSRESIEEYTGKKIAVDNLHVFEYALAYLIHGFNHKSNMRAVVLADSNPSFVSNGRRGKGLILQALKHLKGDGLVIKEDGKAFGNGQFKFQLVRPNTRILILDDVAEDFDFSWLYAAITDAFVVESKGFKRIAFAFEDTPRFVITTNHPCYDEGVSSSERAILLPVSDYFTANARTPYQEFGHLLFDDWDDVEWNRFFDYIVEIIQRYLQRDDPSVIPVIDLTIFNANKLLLKVPLPIIDYLDGLQKAHYYDRENIINDLDKLGFKFRTGQEFSKMLHTYCRLRGYYLDKNTKDGRYISDGKQYICLMPTTPDMFDAKFQKPKR